MKSDNLFSKVLIFIIAMVPLIWMNQVNGVPFQIFIYGTGSWGIGCICKMILHFTIMPSLQRKAKSLLTPSIVNGLISGLCELLAAVLIIVLVRHKTVFDLNAIISFGLAIGALESLVVIFNKGNDLFKGTVLEESSRQLLVFLDGLQGAKQIAFNIILPVLERIIATLLHVSTRGLVFISVLSGRSMPLLIAIIIFVFADGPLAYYYHLSGKLATERGYVVLHVYLFVLAIAGVFLFVIFWSNAFI